MILSIFLSACLVFSIFIIVRQEKTISYFRSQANQFRQDSEQNYLFFIKTEEKRRKLETENFNLKIEIQNIKNLLSNN